MSTPSRGSARRAAGTGSARRAAAAVPPSRAGGYAAAGRRHRSPIGSGVEAAGPSPRRAAAASLGYSRNKASPAAREGYSRAGPSPGRNLPEGHAFEGPADFSAASHSPAGHGATPPSSATQKAPPHSAPLAGRTPDTKSLPPPSPPVESPDAQRRADALCRMTDTVSRSFVCHELRWRRPRLVWKKAQNGPRAPVRSLAPTETPPHLPPRSSARSSRRWANRRRSQLAGSSTMQ